MLSAVPTPLAKAGGAVDMYHALTQTLSGIGEYRIEEKKTCLHMATGSAAFLGVHPRKHGFRLTLVLARPLEGDRILKCEQASKSRFYSDLEVCTPADFDAELVSWLKEAYDLRANHVKATGSAS